MLNWRKQWADKTNTNNSSVSDIMDSSHCYVIVVVVIATWKQNTTRAASTRPVTFVLPAFEQEDGNKKGQKEMKRRVEMEKRMMEGKNLNHSWLLAFNNNNKIKSHTILNRTLFKRQNKTEWDFFVCVCVCVCVALFEEEDSLENLHSVLFWLIKKCSVEPFMWMTGKKRAPHVDHICQQKKKEDDQVKVPQIPVTFKL